MTTMTHEAHPSTGDSLAERYQSVRRRIAEAARRSRRDPDGVVLVAVTKYAEPDQIREIIRLGQVDLGENRVQQLTQRAPMIAEWLTRQRAISRDLHHEPDALPEQVRWHMIGHLQRNKARKAVEFCRLIHSVDSLRLAEELQHIASRREDITVDVLLEVNAAGEASKSGVALPAAFHLAEQIDTMVQVRLRGLMTMAPLTDDPETSRPVFARMRELFEDIRKADIGKGHFNILSMGMTGDFEVAIEEGSNMVRIGSAIFGEPAHRDDEDHEGDSDGDSAADDD